MIRPYISGPMSNYKNHNFPAFFEADGKLREQGYEPINPAAYNVSDVESSLATWQEAHAYSIDYPEHWHAYIKADLRLVLQADGVVLLPGWEKSRGACVEVVAAANIDIPIYRLTEEFDVVRFDYDYAPYQRALVHLLSCSLD